MEGLLSMGPTQSSFLPGGQKNLGQSHTQELEVGPRSRSGPYLLVCIIQRVPVEQSMHVTLNIMYLYSIYFTLFSGKSCAL